MIPMADELRYLSEMKRHIEWLGRALPVLQQRVGDPAFVNELHKFRYNNPTSETIQFLLCVRIVSGLHGAVLLCSVGHIVEAGVLLRTIDDFLGDVIFVEEARRTDEPTAVQRRFIENYFLESSNPEKQHVTRRQKVRTAEGRFLSEDWYTVADITKHIDVSLDSYVHGEYGPSMDLFVKGKNSRFEVFGVNGTPGLTTFRLIVGMLAHRAYCLFIMLASAWNMPHLAQCLAVELRSFQNSEPYMREHDPE
jgi:hypothetical protein